MRFLRRHTAFAAILAVATSCGVSTSQPAGPAVASGPPAPAETPVPLPNREGSLKFLAFGDFGTGEPAQYQLAKQMATLKATFNYELVILLGDNLYGSERPKDFAVKFEDPYKPLLDAGVKFQAALGNHDAREQTKYAKFGMNGQLYYTFKAARQPVRFFALDSSYMDPKQIAWLEKELKGSTDEWKIAYFHHPLYSSAKGHGSTLALRDELAPLFIRYNVSVVFAGHDHVYERTKPQDGIVYFVAGSGGKLRAGDLIRTSAITAKGFDTDLAFLAVEIDGDTMIFRAISRTGAIVDSGVVIRRKAATGVAHDARPSRRSPGQGYEPAVPPDLPPTRLTALISVGKVAATAVTMPMVC
jgi:predicted phosphodiesterase